MLFTFLVGRDPRVAQPTAASGCVDEEGAKMKSPMANSDREILPDATSGNASGEDVCDERTAAVTAPASKRYFEPTRLEDVAGMLSGKIAAGRILSIEEMDEAVLAEARRMWARHLRELEESDPDD